MTFIGIVTTVLVAGALAVVTTVGVLQVTEKTPAETKPVNGPVLDYGTNP
jgi:hypothetical protein